MKKLFIIVHVIASAAKQSFSLSRLPLYVSTSLAMTVLFTLTLLGLVSLSNQAQAQIPHLDLKLDSLVKVNESYKTEDLKKLKMLNLLAKGYDKLNPAKGIETADLAIALAKKLNNEPEQAASLHYKAANILAKGDAKQAIALYEQAMAINEKHKNEFGIGENLRSIGLCYQKLSNPSKALEYFDKSLTICQRQQNKKGMSAVLVNLAAVYYNLSDYPKAMECHRKAMSIDEQLGNKSGMAYNLGSMGSVYYVLSDFTIALEHYQKALGIYEQLGDKTGMAKYIGNIGGVYHNLSDYPKALEYYQKSLRINEQLGYKAGMAINLGSIGSIYANLADYSKSLEYHQKALNINEQLGNKWWMAVNLGNMGNAYNYSSNFHKAMEYHQQALSLSEQVGNKKGIALNLGRVGSDYMSLFDYPKALEYHQKALTVQEQIGDKGGKVTSLRNIGMIWSKAPDSVLKQMKLNPEQRISKSAEYLNSSLQLAKEIGNVDFQREAWAELTNAYEKQGNYSKAYEAYKNFIVLRDSIESDEVKKTIERKEMQYDFDKKETQLKYEKQLSDEKFVSSQQELGLRQKDLALSNKEKDLQHLAFLKEKAEKQEKEKQLTITEKEKQLQATQIEVLGKEKKLQAAELETRNQELATKQAQRNLFIAGTALMLLLASSIFVGLRRTAKEKKRSEELLLNILPEEVAEELKQKGEAEAKLIDEVTVLFTDFKGFTALSEKLTPKELVRDLHECFTAFDNIMQKHGLEKIKTIGDAYMAAGGLPTPNKTHAQDVVSAALEIRKFMDDGKARKLAANQPFFEIRIGVHTGPVVAGIVGVKKFSYDIWGDTVNTASRMESSGEVGKVNISETTYQLVKDKFNCEYRGEIEAKGKGKIKMYFVES